jgi:hypothetical protein
MKAYAHAHHARHHLQNEVSLRKIRKLVSLTLLDRGVQKRPPASDFQKQKTQTHRQLATLFNFNRNQFIRVELEKYLTLHITNIFIRAIVLTLEAGL